MLNHTTVMGRLTANPELRKSQSGLSVCSFTLAVERDTADKQSGQRGVDWIDCVAWRQTAEFLDRYFSKGRMAVVTGRLQTRTWEDKQGVKHKSTELVADHIYFCDSKKDDGGSQSGYSNGYQTGGYSAPANSNGGYIPSGTNRPGFPQGVEFDDRFGQFNDAYGDFVDSDDDGELPF